MHYHKDTCVPWEGNESCKVSVYQLHNNCKLVETYEMSERTVTRSIKPPRGVSLAITTRVYVYYQWLLNVILFSTYCPYDTLVSYLREFGGPVGQLDGV